MPINRRRSRRALVGVAARTACAPMSPSLFRYGQSSSAPSQGTIWTSIHACKQFTPTSGSWLYQCGGQSSLPTATSVSGFADDSFTSTPAVPCAQKATIRDGLPKGPNRPIADLAGDEQIGYRTWPESVSTNLSGGWTRSARHGRLRKQPSDQSRDRSRHGERSSASLRDLVFGRGDALFLGIVFCGEGGEHGFDVGLPTAEGGSGEDVGRGRVPRAAIDKAPAGPAPDRGRRGRGGPDRGRAWPYGRGEWPGCVFGGGRPSASFETCATRPLILSHSVAAKLHGIRSRPILQARL